MGVRFHFSDARTWRYMVASIEKIIDEGVIVASSEGVSLRALDTSHVAMVDLFYPASAFVEYSVDGEESRIGVSFNVLAKILRRARKEDELIIEADDSTVTIIFSGRGERTFRIPQIQLSYEKLPDPKISFTVRGKMLGSTFREAIKDLEPHSDVITIEASDEALYFTGSSEIVRAEIELSLERQTLLDLEVDSPDKSSYSIEYFTEMLNAAQAAEVVGISYAGDAPVRVDMEYMGGGRLTFYVSPRVE